MHRMPQGIVKAGISSRNAADVKAVMLAALALARELMDAGLMDQQQGAGDVLAFCAGLAVGVSRLQQQPAAGEGQGRSLGLVLTLSSARQLPWRYAPCMPTTSLCHSCSPAALCGRQWPMRAL